MLLEEKREASRLDLFRPDAFEGEVSRWPAPFFMLNPYPQSKKNYIFTTQQYIVTQH
jgi:hypothetical protein